MPTIPHPASTSQEGAAPGSVRRHRGALSLDGQRFGMLLVLSRDGTKHGVSTWLCRCDCGMEKVRYSHHLKRGEVVSCGCQAGVAGGKAAHAKGTAHQFTSAEAREAGRKGGSHPKVKKAPHEKKKPDYRSPIARYTSQRGNAKKRGIAWEFTFEAWWTVWCESGKWEQCGTRLGQYVMARYGDVGPYSPSNVRITTSTENAQECRRIYAAKHPDVPFFSSGDRA